MLKTLRILCFFVWLLPIGALWAEQSELDAEIARYKQIHQTGSEDEQMLAVQQAKWLGLSETALFDLIENNVKRSLATGLKNQNYVSWMVQGLAFSGQEKYIPTIRQVSRTKKRKIKRHSQRSLEVLPQFKRWNPVISHGLEKAPKGELKIARVLNMLGAEDPELVRAGASHAYVGLFSHPKIQEKLAARIEELYPKADDSADEIAEAVAWMMKALAESGRRSYAGLFRRVHASAKHRAVERWAYKSHKKLTR